MSLRWQRKTEPSEFFFNSLSQLFNGGVYFGDLYYQNAILTEATLEFSDGTRREINLRVYDGMQTIEFPEVLTSSVKIICRGVKPGERWQDVCISEFRALVAKQE